MRVGRTCTRAKRFARMASYTVVSACFADDGMIFDAWCDDSVLTNARHR